NRGLSSASALLLTGDWLETHAPERYRWTAYCLLPTGDWLPVQRHAQELVALVEQAIVHRGSLAGVDVVGDQIVERDLAALHPVDQQPHGALAHKWEVLAR